MLTIQKMYHFITQYFNIQGTQMLYLGSLMIALAIEESGTQHHIERPLFINH